MSDKKFANLHYPGMKANPEEGVHSMPPELRERFEAQIRCIGESAQLAVGAASALVIGPTPLGTRVAKKLLLAGMGRVGMFGQAPLTGAHEFSAAAETPLKAMSAWAKAEAPWGQFESFSSESIDRNLGDIARGFDFLIATGEGDEIRRVIALANEHDKTAVVAGAAGYESWHLCGKGLDAANIMEFDGELDQAGGLYLPMLDSLAATLSALIVDSVVKAPSWKC